jgi:hypothetical protein
MTARELNLALRRNFRGRGVITTVHFSLINSGMFLPDFRAHAASRAD